MIFAAYTAVNREQIWAALFTYLKSKLTAPAWAPLTAVVVGQLITDPAGHLQKALESGTTAAAIPTFNDAGGTTADGTGGTALTWRDTGPGFVSMGRKHVPPPDLTIADQPALFQVAAREIHVPTRPPGAPTKTMLRGFLILYVYGPTIDEDIGSEQTLGETLLNNLLFAIDAAMLPDNVTTGKFTIGGLVEHCWLDGDSDLDPGIFGPQAAAILPVHVLVP